MKILVTGAAGFIGSHMCEALLKKGHDVIGIDAITDYYNTRQKELNRDEIIGRGVTFFQKDLASDDLSNVVSECDFVFHFAAQPGISSKVPFEAYERNNVLATFRLLEALKANTSLKLFVNVATSSVYGLHAIGDEESTPQPASHYGVTKLAAEQLALSYHRQGSLPVTSFRPFSVYGERERPEKLYPRLIASILDDKEFTLYDGSKEHIRSYTYVGDVVKVLLSAIDKHDICVGEIFNLGTDKTITTGEGIAIVEKIIGKQAKIATVPKRAGDQMETKTNIEKIRKVLGIVPETTPLAGLTGEVAWVEKILALGVAIL